jgi:hypothetical protein
MTVHGKESISHDELGLRLDMDATDLDAHCTRATEEHVLTNLMVSFYFKGGRPELGCEFIHKSFREYLFAEAIVEALKAFGKKHRSQSFPIRKNYWEDFRDSDPRYHLSRDLGKLLAPQWLKPEVVTHVEALLRWEIARAAKPEEPSPAGLPTPPLNLDGWRVVRDALADVWDWWAEGVHLRPQPQLGDEGWLTPEKGGKELTPEEVWRGVSDPGSGPRACQALVNQARGRWVLFAPTGKSPIYFQNYTARINGVGWRPLGSFPLGVDLSGVDLRGASIRVPIRPVIQPFHMLLAHANLSRAELAGGYFAEADLRQVMAFHVFAGLALSTYADLGGADLRRAELSYSYLSHANLQSANLTGATLHRTMLFGSNLEGARIDKGALNAADLDDPRRPKPKAGRAPSKKR